MTADDFATYKADTQKALEGKNRELASIHNDANKFRQLFLDAGGTNEQLALYDENKTLDEAMQEMGLNNVRARNDLLYDKKYQMSADEYFRDRYEYYWNRGATHDQAVEAAGRDAREYQVERRMALNQGLDMFGRTDGRLNDDGMTLERMLALDSPELTNIDLNGYALPKNEYQNDFQYALAKFAQAAGMDKLLQQQAGEQALQDLKNAFAWDLEQDKQEHQNALAEYKEKNANARAANSDAARITVARIRSENSGGKGGSAGKPQSTGGGDSLAKDAENRIKSFEKTAKTLESQIKLLPDGSEEKAKAEEKLLLRMKQ